VVEYLDIQYQGNSLTDVNNAKQRVTIATDSLVSMILSGFNEGLFNYLARGFTECFSINDSAIEKEYYLPDQIQT
jgi:hypothetical protein